MSRKAIAKDAANERIMKIDRVLDIESGRPAADAQILLKTCSHGNKQSAIVLGIAPHRFY